MSPAAEVAEVSSAPCDPEPMETEREERVVLTVKLLKGGREEVIEVCWRGCGLIYTVQRRFADQRRLVGINLAITAKDHRSTNHARNLGGFYFGGIKTKPPIHLTTVWALNRWRTTGCRFWR